MKRLLFALPVFALLAFSFLSFAPAPTKVSGQSFPDTTKWYKLVSKLSGKCVDLENASRNAGVDFMQYTCHGGDNQKFQFRTAATSGYFRIVVGHSRKCADQFNASYSTGAKFGQYFCHGGDNQQFQVISSGGGYYQIRVKHSGMNFDVANGSLLNGAKIVQYTAHGGDNQQFQIIEVDPPPTDADEDGYNYTVDCNDNDSSIFPGAPTFCESGVDRNCNFVDDSQEYGCNPDPPCCF